MGWLVGWRVPVICAALALLMWLVAASYRRAFEAGRTAERQQAAQAYAERQADDHRLAGQLARTARDEATQATAVATRLQKELRHVRNPLVLAPPCAGDGRVRAAAEHSHAVAADAAGHTTRPDAGLVVPPLRDDVPAHAGAGLRLAADAVRLWDSALAGRDVPAGACTAADAAAGACAADSGFTADDAWANHIENATSCRIDRANHRALIEFVTRRSGLSIQSLPVGEQP